jgi:uncharacterized protein (TIGR03435 family)
VPHPSQLHRDGWNVRRIPNRAKLDTEGAGAFRPLNPACHKSGLQPRALLTLSLLLLTIPAHGQVLRSSAPLPSFAVASIRPAAPDSPDGGLWVPPKGSLAAKSATLKTLILFAYGLGSDNELSGGPDWVGSDKFQIDTRLDDAQTAALSQLSPDDRSEQMRLMLQSLLADRFHLSLHSETRELPIYALVIAKSGLKCTKQPADTPFAALPKPRFRMSVGPPPPPPPPGWHPPTTPEEIQAHAAAPLHFRTKGWPFWMLVTVLSHQPETGGRVVLDKTGLDGSYDCEATWAREGADGPSFFSAVQDQMGLKLEPEKAPVEILVIDHADQPSEN